MDSDGKFSFNWGDHSGHFLAAVEKLYDRNDLTDITLVMNEQRKLKCHKIVLASCSTYFYNVFMNNPNESSIVMYNTKYEDMKTIMDYMYRGQINVQPQDLAQISELGRFLGVKGFTDNVEEVDVRIRETGPIPNRPSSHNGPTQNGHHSHTPPSA